MCYQKQVIYFMFYLLFLLISNVWAEPSAKTEVKIKLTRQHCADLLINNKANSSINYQPGIDSRGRKVAPADINASPTPQNYGIGDEVHINLQGYLGKFAPSFPTHPQGTKDFINPVIENSEVSIGKIDVHKDGKVWINGIPTFDKDQAQIEAACRQRFPDL